MSQNKHLLLLGSNRNNDSMIQAAIDVLGELGAVNQLTSVRLLPSDNDDGHSYFNAMVTLDSFISPDQMAGRLKRVEASLGRDRGSSDDVSIDIDVLAVLQNGHWKADAHARDKGEFARAAVQELLHQANVQIKGDNTNRGRS